MESKIHATQLDIGAHGLVLPGGLRIARVAVNAQQPLVHVSPFLLPEGTRLDVEIVARAEDIQDHLNATRPAGLSGFCVKAQEGKLSVVAVASAILPVQVGAEGTLEFVDGRLNFIPSRAEVGGVKAPEGFVKQQLDKLNPLIDLTGWPVETRIKTIEIGGGEIRLSGTLVLTAPVPRREP